MRSKQQLVKQEVIIEKLDSSKRAYKLWYFGNLKSLMQATLQATLVWHQLPYMQTAQW